MTDDIVTQLRDMACCWRGNDPIAIELRQAADEIERLRAELVRKADELAATVWEIRKVEDERDEARRELCRRNRQPCPQDDEVIQLALRIYAEERGWDCFKENKQ
jgi:hypothetical protein